MQVWVEQLFFSCNKFLFGPVIPERGVESKNQSIYGSLSAMFVDNERVFIYNMLQAENMRVMVRWNDKS